MEFYFTIKHSQINILNFFLLQENGTNRRLTNNQSQCLPSFTFNTTRTSEFVNASIES